MLLGFTSRWTMPRRCAAPSPRATSSPIRATSSGSIGAVAAQPRGEVLAVDELHDHVRAVRVGARVEAAHDVPVAQDGGGQGLASEAVGQVGVGDDLGPQELERDGPVERVSSAR